MDIIDIAIAAKRVFRRALKKNWGAENFGKILAVGESGDVQAVNGAGVEVMTADDVLYSGSATYDEGTVGETLKETAADVSTLKSDIVHKANIDGSYSSMTVGNAEQLVATVAVEDSVPYNFRTSGGTADIGDREVDKIVGGTVAWNQLFNYDALPSGTTYNGITMTKANNKIKFQGTATGTDAHVLVASTAFTIGHKYIILGFGTGGSLSTYAYNFNATGTNITRDTVVEFSESLRGNLRFRFYKDAVIDLEFPFTVHDLTQMFGTTIADYIYSLETATPGAGVAWFRKLFPKPYYAYNPGELMSVQAAAHKMVGFNAWDEEWELGSIDLQTGLNTSSSTAIRSKNYIPIVPGQTYYVKKSGLNVGFRLYDANKGYLGYWSANTSEAASSFGDNVCFIRFVTNSTTAYNPQTAPICINLSWDGERDGEYEPYQSWEYPLDDSLTLRGIPKLDSGNGLYYDGDTYESDGTVTRRYGVVDLGTLTWSTRYTGTTNKTLSATLPNAFVYRNTVGDMGFRASKYELIQAVGGAATLSTPDDKSVGLYWLANSSVPNPDTIYMVVPAGETPSGYLVYELITHTTETADPFQSPQIVDDFGTEEYVDAAVAAETRDVAIPVGHNTFYQANLRAKLEMSPDSPDGDGDYIVRQTNGTNEYVPLMKELPTAPTTEGTYHLKATVTSGGVTLTWEADT